MEGQSVSSSSRSLLRVPFGPLYGADDDLTPPLNSKTPRREGAAPKSGRREAPKGAIRLRKFQASCPSSPIAAPRRAHRRAARHLPPYATRWVCERSVKYNGYNNTLSSGTNP